MPLNLWVNGSVISCKNGIFFLEKRKQHFSHNLQNQEHDEKYKGLMSKPKPSENLGGCRL